MTGTLNRHVYAFLLTASGALLAHNSMAAGFYIAEVGTPTSLGTGGVANPTNTYHADAAWTNPAGMTGLERDSMVAGLQVVLPKAEFDASLATAGGDDGGGIGRAGATGRGGGGSRHEPAHQFDAVGGFKKDTFDRAAGLRVRWHERPEIG